MKATLPAAVCRRHFFRPGLARGGGAGRSPGLPRGGSAGRPAAAALGAAIGAILAAGIIAAIRWDPVAAAVCVGAFSAGVASAAGIYWAVNRAGAGSARPTAGMRVVARLMPRTTGQEWLAEAHSILFEASPQTRRAIGRSYLFSTPQVFAAAWVRALNGRVRAARGGWVPGGWGK